MTEQVNDDHINGLVWNIQSGGFDSYHDPDLHVPTREDAILRTIDSYKSLVDTDTVTLTDALAWDDTYGGDDGIADHLGLAEARFARIEDDRMTAKGINAIGIAFATDKKIARTNYLDLETRQGLGVILDIGKYGLQIANVYLDDLSEQVRQTQVRALLSEIEGDMLTLLVGDFNALRSNMRGAKTGIKARDLAVRMLAHMIPNKFELGESIGGMNRRKAIPYIESLGFTDADTRRKRPTAPSFLPAFGVDYVFHNSDVVVSDVDVSGRTGASDHRAISYTAHI